jgi:hypothetical protein
MLVGFLQVQDTATSGFCHHVFRLHCKQHDTPSVSRSVTATTDMRSQAHRHTSQGDLQWLVRLLTTQQLCW